MHRKINKLLRANKILIPKTFTLISSSSTPKKIIIKLGNKNYYVFLDKKKIISTQKVKVNDLTYTKNVFDQINEGKNKQIFKHELLK